MIRPLRDRVLVKPFKYEHPLLYVAGMHLRKGEVLAVGPGRRMRRKVPFRKMPGVEAGAVWVEDGEETGKVRPMRVKVGDVVDYSFRGIFEFRYLGEEYVMVPEQSIYGVDPNGSKHEAVLEPRSAPVAS
jgi:co-chaperonin GroES (HSP10)